MQTDLQLLLGIVVSVLAVYVLFRVITKRRTKIKSLPRDNFEQMIVENTHTMVVAESDPLLEGYNKATVMQEGIVKVTHAEEQVEAIPVKENTITEMTIKESPIKEEPIKEVPVKENHAPAPMLVFSILPKAGATFSGELLSSMLRIHHFHHGKRDIFHCHMNNNTAQPILYSLASLLKPGSFNREEMLKQQFPGILIWMELTGASIDAVTFEKCLTSAKQLTISLNGELCDGRRNPLSMKTIADYRLIIKNYEKEMPLRKEQG